VEIKEERKGENLWLLGDRPAVWADGNGHNFDDVGYFYLFPSCLFWATKCGIISMFIYGLFGAGKLNQKNLAQKMARQNLWNIFMPTFFLSKFTTAIHYP
jgi:hypothetical protein